jgi:segregation and condensation protein A
MSELKINISNFEGPFDLLLHLLKANKMQIKDIRISEITFQYMAYLNAMKELDMEVASEFIVIAATLIEIKSRELLPKYKEEVDENDIKVRLMLRIEEYEAFKQIAEILKERFGKDSYIFTKRAETIAPEEQPLGDFLKGVTMDTLHLTYLAMMNRQKSKINRNVTMDQSIEAEEYRIEDKMEELERILSSGSHIRFLSILEGSKSKSEAIVIFLAILELARSHRVRISQEDIFSEIIIEKGVIDGR